MREEAVTMLSWCFAPVSREEWEAATDVDAWSELLGFLTGETKPSARRDAALRRLAVPPTYEEKTGFASRHFTGGLPGSALPVESLYAQSEAGPFDQVYFREPAWYMRDLAESLGLEIPASFAAYPDHLFLELDMAVFLHAANPEDARDFVAHRFTWLPRYVARLKSINADASFYVAVIEVLMCVVDAWREER